MGRRVHENVEEAQMPKAWNAKRERQYEHIKEGLEDKGRSEDTAEEIAARTVNKERARAGEAEEKSKSSSTTSRRVAAVACGPTRVPAAAPGSSSTKRPRRRTSRAARR